MRAGPLPGRTIALVTVAGRAFTVNVRQTGAENVPGPGGAGLLSSERKHTVFEPSGSAEVVNDQAWIENEFIPTVAKRGAAIIDARGASSAASAASATTNAARDWLLGTHDGDWVSMAVLSDGSYGVPEGLISSFPVTTSNGDWSIVQGLEIDPFSRGRIDATVAELADEKDAVTQLGLI